MIEYRSKPYPLEPDYIIYENGEVYSKKSNKFLNPTLNYRGRLQVGLTIKGQKKTKEIHLLVLESFVSSKPEGMECRHLDGVKLNNHISNLCWGTHKENGRDLSKHNKENKVIPYGAKLNFSKVSIIREKHQQGTTQRELSVDFGVTIPTVSRIVNEKIWV